MINAKKFYWLAQFGGWSAYCGLLILSVYTNYPQKMTPAFFINLAILFTTGIVVTHTQRLIFINLGWLDYKLPRLLPRIILSSLLSSIGIALVVYFADHLTDLNTGGAKPIEIKDIVINIFAVLILVLLWNAIYFTFHFFQKSRNQEMSNLALAASKRESELKNLRSQLNPHFLFNALNSIRALVDIEPKKAKESVTTLSNLLRQSLLLGKENLVTIAEELNIAHSYLDLEKIRFEDRLRIEWEVDHSLEDFMIPPFSLQMMIENAIKHGISNLIEGGLVKVIVRGNDEQINVIVENSGSLSDVTDLGVGIKNVKRRLALQYGEGASFNLSEKDNKVIAQMTFKR